MIDLLKLFLGKILILLVPATIYVFSLIYILRRLGFWDITLIKDTIFWFFGIGLIIFLNLNKAKGFEHFKNIIKKTFRWTIALELLVNLYCFSLPMELLVVPFATILAVMKSFTELKDNYKAFDTILKNILAWCGIVLFAIIIYKTSTHYERLLTLENLKSSLLPLILTSLFIPFAYLEAVYMVYQSMFIRMDLNSNDIGRNKSLKKHILWIANFNLATLNKLDQRMFKLMNCDRRLMERYFEKYKKKLSWK